MVEEKQHSNIIGIDPDVDKSGIAILKEGKVVLLTALPLPALIDTICQNQPCKVYVEASWLVSSNWHMRAFDNRRIASAKGYDVGRNHQVGRDIVEYLKYRGIEVEEIKPLRKIWKGKEGKITQAEFTKLSHYEKRTNQEMRDAFLIAYTRG